MDGINISKEDLSRLVFTDDLTGLYNRRYLYHFLKQNVDWKNPSPAPCAILMIDVDYFKAYNDTYGHLEGDKVLQKIAGIIRGSCGENDTAIRYAGDEFTILLRGTSVASAVQRGEAIRAKMESENITAESEGKSIRLGISIGVASFPEDGNSPETLLDAADKALYFSKNAGKNRVSSSSDFQEKEIADKNIFDTFLCSTYIAPVAAMDRLRDFVEDVRQGTSSFAAIYGEGGSGKTRLLLELVKLYQYEGAICLLEECSPENTGMPYRTITSLLERYFEEHPETLAAVRDRISPSHIAALQGLIKPLGQGEKGVAPPAASPARESRLLAFECLVDILCLLSEESLLMLLFDEFEHADSGTYELINGLLNMKRGKIAVCGTVSPRYVDSRSGPFFDELFQHERAVKISLTPLSLPDTSAMISAILPGREASASFDSVIHEATRGNPLYVQESLKYLLKKRKIALTGEGWRIETIVKEDIPVSLEESLDNELKGLDGETEEMLEKAAVIGPNFRLHILKALSGKNEGETLDIIDKAKKLNLISVADPLDDEKLKFSVKSIREAAYRGIDDSVRKEIHQSIGEIVEIEHRDNPEEVADVLAHHFTEGADTERAQKYSDILQNVSERIFDRGEIASHVRANSSGVRARLEEAKTPLEGGTEPMLVAFLRNFFVTIKNLKLYPAGSRPLVQSADALFGSTRKLFAFANLLTLKLTKETLHINTVPYKAGDIGGTAGDLAALMKEYSISSVTFASKVGQEEIDALIRCFLLPAEKLVTGMGFWNGFLEKNAIKNIDVIQQAFVVEKEEERESTRRFVKGKERRLDDAEMLLMKDVLRYLPAAVDNIQRYPAESQLITFAVDSFFTAVGKIFEGSESLTLADVDGNLIVNGVAANPKVLGQAVTETARILKSRRINSISFMKGMLREESRELLSAMAAFHADDGSAPQYWEAFMNSGKAAHVAIGHRTYAKADTVKMDAPLKPEHVRQAPVQAETRPGEITAETLLALPAEQILQKQYSSVIVSIIENLLFDNRNETIAGLWSHLLENMEHPSPTVRDQAAALFQTILDQASAMALGVIAETASQAVADALRTDQKEEIFARLSKGAFRLARRLVERGDRRNLAKLVWAIGRHPRADLQKSGRGLLKAALAEGLLAPVFNDLASPDHAVRDEAIHIIEGCGDAGIAQLKKVIETSDSPDARRHAVALLDRFQPGALQEIVDGLHPYANPEEYLKIVSALPPYDGRIDKVLMNGLRHNSEKVRKEVSRVVKDIPVDRQQNILGELLEDENPSHQLTALGAISDESQISMSPVLRDLLGRIKDLQVRKECCIALGKIRDKNAVALLAAVVEKKGGWGIFKGEDDEVRSAATWAIGNIPSPESKEILKRLLLTDKSPAVRSAAKFALKE